MWDLFELIKSKSINSIELHIYDSELNLTDLENIFRLYEEFNFIFPHVYSDNTELKILHSRSNFSGPIPIFGLDKFNSNLIHIDDFFCNLKLYSESLNHNSYFNKKIFIDESGNIKNSLSSSDIYGNINDMIDTNHFINVINNDSFQKYWNITKNKCDICKDCEFRHMCIDRRIPIQRNSNEWFYSTECNYNPYISLWKGENGYKNVEECGVISNKNNFILNEERIKAIVNYNIEIEDSKMSNNFEIQKKIIPNEGKVIGYSYLSQSSLHSYQSVTNVPKSCNIA